MTYRNLSKQFSILLALLIGYSAEASFTPAMAQPVQQILLREMAPVREMVPVQGADSRGKPDDLALLDPIGKKGQDGAQNIQRLKRGMKAQSRRTDHQYEQAMLQVKEQQQQQYEKEMLQTLGGQRPVIQQNRNALKQVRQDTGANN